MRLASNRFPDWLRQASLNSSREHQRGTIGSPTVVLRARFNCRSRRWSHIARPRRKSSPSNRFDAFFFDRATSATLLLAAAAREAGLLVMFEPPNVPRTATALRAAELSDIVKTSRRPGNRGRDWELRPDAATRFIVETLGPKGVRVRHRSSTSWGEWQNMPPFPPAQIKDTAGAGDWMTVGLLTNLLPRKDTIGIDRCSHPLNTDKGSVPLASHLIALQVR